MLIWVMKNAEKVKLCSSCTFQSNLEFFLKCSFNLVLIVSPSAFLYTFLCLERSPSCLLVLWAELWFCSGLPACCALASPCRAQFLYHLSPGVELIYKNKPLTPSIHPVRRLDCIYFGETVYSKGSVAQLTAFFCFASICFFFKVLFLFVISISDYLKSFKCLPLQLTKSFSSPVRKLCKSQHKDTG